MLTETYKTVTVLQNGFLFLYQANKRQNKLATANFRQQKQLMPSAHAYIH